MKRVNVFVVAAVATLSTFAHASAFGAPSFGGSSSSITNSGTGPSIGAVPAPAAVIAFVGGAFAVARRRARNNK